MKIVHFMIVNVIVLGFIAFTLLAQFGVHIKVDKDVELVPVDIGYSQSIRRINGKSVLVTGDCYVHLKYEKDERKSFSVPALAVFERVRVDDIERMIKDGVSIERNVFFNTKTDKVIGVTAGDGSILSLYYNNSKMFRYGIWILVLCDIFVVLLVKFVNRKNGNKQIPEEE